MTAAETVAERVAADRAMFQAGWNSALAAHPPCEHTHPAIADSVARIFHGWDGADAALARSVAHFHEWHAHQRAQQTKAVTPYADAA